MFGFYLSAQELVNAEEEKQIHPWSTYTMVDEINPASVL
jgi:hypothetical protein